MSGTFNRVLKIYFNRTGTIKINKNNSINFIESTCQKNLSALINSPFRVSTDILNKTTKSHAILMPINKNNNLNNDLRKSLKIFSEISLLDDETIISIAILIVPAESSPVKMPGQRGVISTISLNER